MDHRLIYHLIRVFPSHPHQELFSESADDAEMREMAREEVKDLERRTKELDEQLKLLLLPSDPNDEKNVMFEIRAGTGGDEAAIWASDLLRLYTKYAESQGWQARVVSLSESDAGGCRDATIEVRGDSVYSKLKFEAGVHRVQRVPQTETQGRVHTSTATVAIMPEVDEVTVRHPPPLPPLPPPLPPPHPSPPADPSLPLPLPPPTPPPHLRPPR